MKRDAETLRTKRVQVYVKPVEFSILDRAAAVEKTPVSEWARAILLAAARRRIEQQEPGAPQAL